MPSYQNNAEMTAPDIAIIGGGIVGLWTAYYAAQAGQSVLLIDSQDVGKGASYGVLGALMPHQPTNWNAKKQFQLDGLTTLPQEIAKLEKLTGVECGYFRCGRVMPITNAEQRKQSARFEVGARDYWVRPYEWVIADENPAKGWIIGKGNHGYNTDTLSARIDPRGLLHALETHLRAQSNVTILENAAVKTLSANGSIELEEGSKITPHKTIVTAGVGSFALLEPLTGQNLGNGVKGQAAVLQPSHPIEPSMPIIYDKSVYVIMHENGHVAVGSTSEREFADATTTDGQLDDVIEAARILCPALQDAEVVERWAGVRPNASGRDPMIGTLPNHPSIIVATGGFKITLGIAHIMARSALAAAAGYEISIPESFRTETHLLAAMKAEKTKLR